jgi:hypothetical membrane protein
MTRVIKAVANQYSYIGSIMWTLSVQYFVIQVIVARSWTTHYSLSKNYISDLGNTSCGQQAHSYICSPMHSVMNLSFTFLGVSMLLGSIFLYRVYKSSIFVLIGFICMSISGLGTILVGLFPENTVTAVHSVGAALIFSLGNIALILLGATLKMPKLIRLFAISFGIIALFAFALFLSHTYLGLGKGGMERLVAYPQTIWLIIFGIYALKVNLKNK